MCAPFRNQVHHLFTVKSCRGIMKHFEQTMQTFKSPKHPNVLQPHGLVFCVVAIMWGRVRIRH